MKIVERDCGDYVELIPQGLLVNSDKVVAMAGPAELLPRKANSTYFTVPPIVFKCPKELPENMTLETLANQIYQEAIDKFKVSFKEGFEKATARNQTAHTVTHEDNSMDQEEAGAGGGADILGMKELHSSLDNCAKGHCAACNVNCKGAGSCNDL